MPRKTIVIWEPQPGPQAALITCPCFEVFFGGARGGGKTDGMLGEFVSHASQYGANAIGLMIRREYTQLVETIERSKLLFTPLGAHHTDKGGWRFPDGARLRFAHLDQDSDADAYQGHSYTRVYVEEIGTFPSKVPVMKLMATLRSGAGVPCGFRATGNPGGPGHQWVKERYIDPAPGGWRRIWESFANPFDGSTVKRDRIYIPSRVTDNRFLGADYIANIQMSGSSALVQAWLEGDWSVIAGAFFDCWSSQKHVRRPHALPAHWMRFRMMDWGSAKPFSIGWYAVSDGEMPEYPPGALIKYREWYGCSEANVGIKMTAEDLADGILDRDGGERIAYAMTDTKALAEEGGPSIAERMYRRTNGKVAFTHADQKRDAGWDQLRARLVGYDGVPMLYFFSTCAHTIRTLPSLQHDEHTPEDVDTDGEDHAADETRYACMSRPFTAPKPVVARDLPVKTFATTTLDEMWKSSKAAGRRV